MTTKTIAQLNASGTPEERLAVYVAGLAAAFRTPVNHLETDQDALKNLGHRFNGWARFEVVLHGIKVGLNIRMDRHGRLEAKSFCAAGSQATYVSDSREFHEGKNNGFTHLDAAIIDGSAKGVAERHARLCDLEGMRAQLKVTVGESRVPGDTWKFETRVYDTWVAAERGPAARCVMTFTDLTPEQAKALALAAQKILE